MSMLALVSHSGPLKRSQSSFRVLHRVRPTRTLSRLGSGQTPPTLSIPCELYRPVERVCRRTFLVPSCTRLSSQPPKGTLYNTTSGSGAGAGDDVARSFPLKKGGEQYIEAHPLVSASAATLVSSRPVASTNSSTNSSNRSSNKNSVNNTNNSSSNNVNVNVNPTLNSSSRGGDPISGDIHAATPTSSIFPGSTQPPFPTTIPARDFFVDGGGGGGRGDQVGQMAKKPVPNPANEWMGRLMNPKAIVQHLDEYVIGQERAKKTLAVAVYNHYSRVRENLRQQQQQQIQESHAGTHSATGSSHSSSSSSSSSAASATPVYYGSSVVFTEPPFTKATSTNKSQAFVHGDSCTTPVNETTRNPSRPWLNATSNGHSPSTPSSSTSISTGTSAAAAFVRPFDGFNAAPPPPPPPPAVSSSRVEEEKSASSTVFDKTTPFTQAGYVGEDVEMVIHRLLQNCDYDIKKAECGIVFIDEIDKISKRPDAMSISKDVSGEGVQQALLRMLEGTVIHVTEKNGPPPNTGSGWNGAPSGTTGRKGGLPGAPGSGTGPGAKGEVYAVDTSNILFILSGAFMGLERIVTDRVSKGSIGFDAVVRPPSSELEHAKDAATQASRLLDQVDPADLVKFGLIPEFIGRLPVVAAVNHLDERALVRILTEPRNSLVKQYKGLFGLGDVKIHFSLGALHAISAQAIEKQTGARGLRRIMESLLLDVMYDAPGSSIKHVVIDRDVVQGKKPALCFSHGEEGSVEEALVRDDMCHQTAEQRAP
ncbi:hypothetical protein BGZ94_000643 [Podila epigama]|nr:hypothetical protein BGZ94_000643 [Podila epigama]